MNSNEIAKRDLSCFKKATTKMIATNESAYNGRWNYESKIRKIKNYTLEEIERIIQSGSLTQQQELSENYFLKDGFYKRIIIYYATLLKYSNILIPNPSYNKKLSSPPLTKKYYEAMNFIEGNHVKDFCTECALKALIKGGYYGIVLQANKKNFLVLDLPNKFSRSRYKDENGNDLVEFDLSYFNYILDEDDREEALNAYPKFISKAYNKYNKGKISRWIFIPSEMSICFPFYGGMPAFLNVIPSTINYDDAVEIERERDLEEIRKIIVQKVPHTTNGDLVFEPDEAEEMHRGAVNMMKGNKNVSVLTTYCDVDSIISKTSSDSVSNNLEKMVNNIYYQSGASGQLFASNSNLSLESSIKNDIAFMMPLANKFSKFITNIINKIFGNNSISFSFNILPISIYNQESYADSVYKLANSGYSLLLPAIAMDLSQRDLINIKELENEVLKLDKKLIPLSSSFTQSSNEVGAPEKEPEEKSPKTIQNEESLDKQGVSVNE